MLLKKTLINIRIEVVKNVSNNQKTDMMKFPKQLKIVYNNVSKSQKT